MGDLKIEVWDIDNNTINSNVLNTNNEISWVISDNHLSTWFPTLGVTVSNLDTKNAFPTIKNESQENKTPSGTRLHSERDTSEDIKKIVVQKYKMPNQIIYLFTEIMSKIGNLNSLATKLISPILNKNIRIIGKAVALIFKDERNFQLKSNLLSFDN